MSRPPPSSGAPPSNSVSQSSSGPSHDVQQPAHCDQPSSQAHGDIRSDETRNITNTENDPRNDNASDTDDDGDNPGGNTNVPVRRCQNLNNTVPIPTQLRFYSGCWVDVLKDAKYQYRFRIHTDEPFPEHSHDSLANAHESLIEAIGKFHAEVKLELNEGSLQLFLTGID